MIILLTNGNSSANLSSLNVQVSCDNSTFYNLHSGYYSSQDSDKSCQINIPNYKTKYIRLYIVNGTSTEIYNAYIYY